MALTKEKKNQLMGEFHVHDNDTGSPEVQVALLTTRIQDLTEHLKEHKKDFATRRGLIRMVSKRRKLLRYLHDNNLERFTTLTERLGLEREASKISAR